MKQLTLVLSLMAIIAANANAAETLFEGKIQGASYALNHTVQATSANDPKLVLEPEFVLQTKDGSVYFLPNVPRSMKTKAINTDVKVYGTATKTGSEGNTIFVNHIDVKYGDKYVPLCNWEEKIRDNEH
jgi:ABC-type nitrate/sulfonate/bicarbonate transport system substrate-binding protein